MPIRPCSRCWLRSQSDTLNRVTVVQPIEAEPAYDGDFVLPRLATGGAITSTDDVEQLLDTGITHVISLRDSFNDQPLFKGFPITLLWNGTPDNGQHKDPQWFGASLRFAMPALAQPWTKVLAHCESGIDRGPSTAFAIMLALGFDPETAINLIHQRRPATIGGIAYAADAESAVETLGYV
jgi:dual specificity phosphatase 3